jgi:hypothetical protein
VRVRELRPEPMRKGGGSMEAGRMITRVMFRAVHRSSPRTFGRGTKLTVISRPSFSFLFWYWLIGYDHGSPVYQDGSLPSAPNHPQSFSIAINSSRLYAEYASG